MRPGQALLQQYEAAFHRYDPTFNAVAESGRWAVNREFGEMIRRANSARVTFYCVDGSADSGTTGVTSEQAAPNVDPAASFMNVEDLRQSLEAMAGATGGRTLVAGPGLAATLASAGTTNAWADNTTLPGWYASKTLGGATVSTYRADAGSSTAGLKPTAPSPTWRY